MMPIPSTEISKREKTTTTGKYKGVDRFPSKVTNARGMARRDVYRVVYVYR